MGEEDEPIKRKSDGDEDFDSLDAIAEDFLTAQEGKDKGLLKSALEAFCEYVRDELAKDNQ